MAEQNKKQQALFRQESLERLSSPEQLDQLMRVVSPRNWLALMTLGCFVVAGVAWSVLARLPVVVVGQGVFVQPGQVQDLQATVSGRLVELRIAAGDRVERGDVIAVIEQAEVRAQIQQSQARLLQLQTQQQLVGGMQTQRTSADVEAIRQQRQSLEQRIRDIDALLPDLQTINPALQEQELQALDQQALNLEERLQDAIQLDSTLRERFETRQALFADRGAISQDSVLEAEQTYLNNLRSISELRSQLDQLEVRRIEVDRNFLDSRNRIVDLASERGTLFNQLSELSVRERALEQQNMEATNERNNQLQEVQNSIALLELQLEQNSQIRSEVTGIILETITSPGQSVGPGVRLASVALENPDQEITALVFFPVRDGKKVEPGMPMQITPDTTQRERYGGILATVQEVDPFPATRAGILSLVGNEQMAEAFGREPQIGVTADLQRDPSNFSGYEWSSSQGPNLEITPGTTATARVTVEEQAPITFVFPILRSLTGLY
ncbi:MAG: NHLP bacteriocin system secretion protein [Cyanophyceae cyanobacterium]